MDSAIILSLMPLAIVALQVSAAMLAGFHATDEHLRRTDLDRNLPVLHGPARRPGARGLSGYRPTSRCCLRANSLERFPAYLQQLTKRESNGKYHDRRPSRRRRHWCYLVGRAGT